MGLQHEQPVGPRVGRRGEVEQVRVVAQRLRHLLAADLDEAVVDPVPGEVLAEGLGLGPLVLVVGEGEVLAAAVDVEALAEQLQGHDHALGVPARPARAPGRVPRGLPRLGLLPEHEVQRRALLVLDLDAGSGAQRVQGLAGQRAVALDALGGEVDAIGGLVGPARVHEVADHRDHLVDVGGGVGIEGRALHPDEVHALVPAASNSTATSAGSRPSSLPLLMIVSSMSVMFET